MTRRLSHHQVHYDVVLILALTACAAVLRLHQIESLPPAAGYDAAYYGVDALQLLRGETPRVMYPPNREPLFSFLVAASFLVGGPSAAAIHFTSAVVGIATVPAVYVAAKTLFRGADRPLSRWGPPVAASVITLSYWHLNWSRLGVRAILVPFFAATTLALLWHGLHTHSTASFVACGVSLGLSMYTYQAARVLPLLAIAGFVTFTLRQGSITKRNLLHLALVGTTSLIVFLPLGIHFLNHPDSFSHRIEEAFVAQSSQTIVEVVKAVLNQLSRALLALAYDGDDTPYSTISGRPSLNPFLSVMLVFGLVVSLLHITSSHHLLLLAWFTLMFIPAALAEKGPTAKRALGALPPAAMLIAVGVLAPWSRLKTWAERGSPLRKLSWLGWRIAVLAGLAGTGLLTYRDYFVKWASNPNLPKHFQAGVSAMGDYVGALPSEEQVYLSPELPSHPSIRFHSRLRDDIRGYNGRVCLAAPSRTVVSTTYVIGIGVGDTSLASLEEWFPGGQVVADDLTIHQEAFIPYRIPADARANLQPEYSLDAAWATGITLAGYDLGKEVYQSGDTLSLALFYRARESISKRYTAFVHLLGPHNPATGSDLWAQHDSEPCAGFYPTTSWHAGELLMDRVTLSLPKDAPSGAYSLTTGFYDAWTGERLPVHAKAASTRDDCLALGEISVTAEE